MSSLETKRPTLKENRTHHINIHRSREKKKKKRRREMLGTKEHKTEKKRMNE